MIKLLTRALLVLYLRIINDKVTATMYIYKLDNPRVKTFANIISRPITTEATTTLLCSAFLSHFGSPLMPLEPILEGIHTLHQVVLHPICSPNRLNVMNTAECPC